MSNKGESNFLLKYKDRLENMGKDGIDGIIKTLKKPIDIQDDLLNWKILSKGLFFLIQLVKKRITYPKV